MWKCDKCEKVTNKIKIDWVEKNGKRIDFINYFCPSCGSDELTHQGTLKERMAFWKKELTKQED